MESLYIEHGVVIKSNQVNSESSLFMRNHACFPSNTFLIPVKLAFVSGAGQKEQVEAHVIEIYFRIKILVHVSLSPGCCLFPSLYFTPKQKRERERKKEREKRVVEIKDTI